MMAQYYHAEKLNYLVCGTTNKSEAIQGLFVKYGDGGVDIEPIAHLYKTQIYQLAEDLGVIPEIIDRAPCPDTYSAPVTDEEWFFRMPFKTLDLLLYAWENKIGPGRGLPGHGAVGGPGQAGLQGLREQIPGDRAPPAFPPVADLREKGMNSISIIGTGYVGLVTGTCLSEFGLNVICMDSDAQKIRDLEEGRVPIYEPGLPSLIAKNVAAQRLCFTTDIARAVTASQVIFLAVPTPPGEDGSADLQYILAASDAIAEHMTDYKVIVNKSTVPVGTGRKVKDVVRSRLERRGLALDCDVVSNPEFLREGSAIRDFMHPDRIVIGSDNERSREIVREIYNVLYLIDTPFIFSSLETAELIKYASNAFLATKIAFINEVASLCDAVHADIRDVAKAMGMDGRIGKYFLHPGARVRRQLPAQGHPGPGQDRARSRHTDEHRRFRRQSQRFPETSRGPEDRIRALGARREGRRRPRLGLQAGDRRYPRVAGRCRHPRDHPKGRPGQGLRPASDG